MMRWTELRRTVRALDLAQHGHARSDFWNPCLGICPATLDLRFVPDDLVPPHEPTSVATEVPKKFSGPAMLRSATGHTKVKCTWDEAPPQRRKDLMKKRFSPAELADMDLRDYLASSSDESEAKGEAAKELKALVANSDSEGGGGGDDCEDSDSENPSSKPSKADGNMEATFSVKASMLEQELSERAQKQGGRGVHTLESEEPKSAWQKYLDKRKEKRREKRQKAREEKAKLKGDIGKEAGTGPKLDKQNGQDGGEDLELLVEAETADGVRSFNLRGPQRQAHDHGVKDAAAFQMDVHDRRLEKVFNSADFEIDPTNPEFRKSEGMSEVLREKRKRRTKAVPRASAGEEAPPATKLAKPAMAATSGKAGLQLFASTRPISKNSAEAGMNLAETADVHASVSMPRTKKTRKKKSKV